jgi:protein-tyrosine-phosphatase
VIPCDDQRILPLQKERERLLKLARIELLDPEVQRITSSKQESCALASQLGVPVAPSILVQSEVDLDAAIQAMTAPYVIKPVSSFTLEDLQTRNEVRKVFSSERARAIAREFLKNSPLQIQENFIGRGTGVEFLAAKGEILAIFQHLRVHEPLHGGGSSYRTGIEIHPQMRAATEAIVRELRYDGVGMIEYKWNPQTDHFIFIEVNARFWGSLPLAVASGADFPAFLYDYRIHGQRQFPKRFKTGLYARNWVQDVDWLRANASENRADPLLSTLPWSEVAREFWHILLGRERIDTLTHDDPYPFFVELGAWSEAKLKVLVRKASRRLLELPWICAVQSSRLRARLRTAKHIEFVCYGNICRSPFAAATLRERLTDMHSRATTGSSGFHDRIGRSSPLEAIAAARERGIDLTTHRSQRINRNTVLRSDVILVFDWKNLQQLEAEFPEAKGKTFLLGILDQGHPIAIADPWGETIDSFRQTYERIARCLST